MLSITPNYPTNGMIYIFIENGFIEIQTDNIENVVNLKLDKVNALALINALKKALNEVDK